MDGRDVVDACGLDPNRRYSDFRGSRPRDDQDATTSVPCRLDTS
jgi:hypothetical protein